MEAVLQGEQRRRQTGLCLLWETLAHHASLFRWDECMLQQEREGFLHALSPLPPQNPLSLLMCHTSPPGPPPPTLQGSSSDQHSH